MRNGINLITALLIILQACQPAGQTPAKMAAEEGSEAISETIEETEVDESEEEAPIVDSSEPATSLCFKQAFRCDDRGVTVPLQAWDPSAGQWKALRQNRVIACSWSMDAFDWDWNTQGNLGQMASDIVADFDDQSVVLEVDADYNFASNIVNQTVFNELANDDSQVRIFVDELNLSNHYDRMIFIEVLDENIELSFEQIDVQTGVSTCVPMEN